MKNEIVTLTKTLFIVIGGVLLANYLDRKYLSSKVSLPTEVKE
jgi:hypothetical protein